MHQIAASGGGCCIMEPCTADAGHWNSSPNQQLLQDSQCPVSNRTAMRSEECQQQFHSAAQSETLLSAVPADQAASERTCNQLHSIGGSPDDMDEPAATSCNACVHKQLTQDSSSSDSCSNDSSSQQGTLTAAHSSSTGCPASGTAVAAGSSSETDREADGCWFNGGVDTSALDSTREGSMIDEGSWATSSEAGSSDTFSDIGDPAATEVVYVREGVGVWPSRTRRILGRLSLVKQHAVLFLAWLPYSATAAPAAPAAAAAVPRADASSHPAAAAASAGSGSSNGNAAAAVEHGPASTAEPPHAIFADGFCVLGQPEEEQQQQQGEDQDAPSWGDGASRAENNAEDGCHSTDVEQQQGEQHKYSGLLPVPLGAPRHHHQQQQQQQQCAQQHSSSNQQPAAAMRMPAALRQQRSSSASSVVRHGDSLRSLYAVHPVPLSDIKAFVKHTPPLGCHHVTVVLNSGLTLPPLYFHNGGVREFIATLKQHACLVKAAGNSSTYLVNDTADPLQRCLLALDVADILLGAPPPGASCVEAPAGGPVAAAAWDADADGWADEPGWGRPAGSSTSSAAASAAAAAAEAVAAASSRRSKLSGAVVAAAAVGSGCPALPHLPWGGFGVGYAGASSYYPAAAVQHAAVAAEGSSAGSSAAAAAGALGCSPEEVAIRSSFHISSRGGSSSACSRPVGLSASIVPDWGSTLSGALGSTFSTHLTNTLSKVGQLAMDGANTLVAAAVESWHAETVRYYEHEVDFRPDWGEQGVGLRVTPVGKQEFVQGPLMTPVQLHDSSSSGFKALSLPSVYIPDRPSSAPGSVEALVAAAASAPMVAAAVQQQEQQVDTGSSPAAATVQSGSSPGALTAAAVAADATLQRTSHPSSQPGQSSQSSSQAGAAAADVDTSLGPFELLEGVAPDQLAAVRSRAPPPPLSTEELNSFLDSAGVMVNEAGFREKVFQAGIEPSARREAWKFLLGVYPAGSSAAARQEQRTRQEQQYAALKTQWGSIGPEQAKRWGKWRERRSRIDKDVRRTDRLHPFYRGRGRDAARHLTCLRDVLRCYCLFNWDVGYCQGMSDLAGPLLVVMEGDEVDAFWSFVGLMERMSSNFATNQAGMHSQLAALRQLVQVLDPQLHAFFEARDCLNYFFAFRWLLIHFKREFPFEQVLSLWEACWSCPLTPHLHLYLAAAVLIQHRRLLLSDAALDFDGMLRFCVELSGKLDLHGCLRLAEALALIAGQAGAELLQGLP